MVLRQRLKTQLLGLMLHLISSWTDLLGVETQLPAKTGLVSSYSGSNVSRAILKTLANLPLARRKKGKLYSLFGFFFRSSQNSVHFIACFVLVYVMLCYVISSCFIFMFSAPALQGEFEAKGAQPLIILQNHAPAMRRSSLLSCLKGHLLLIKGMQAAGNLLGFKRQVRDRSTGHSWVSPANICGSVIVFSSVFNIFTPCCYGNGPQCQGS